MSGPGRTIFAELSPEESVALLKRNHVGRLAFTFHDRVNIEPISYVYEGDWLYARTSPGTKLTTVHHHPYVAFEVDEIHGRSDWRSVVVRGTIYFYDPERAEREKEEFDRALAVLRSADPAAMTDDDFAPHRRTIFRIHTDEITGRSASVV